MDKDEIMDKAKDLVSGGNIDDAKSFIEDHKDDLGDYYDQAKDLLGGGASGIMDKLGGLFGGTNDNYLHKSYNRKQDPSVTE